MFLVRGSSQNQCSSEDLLCLSRGSFVYIYSVVHESTPPTTCLSHLRMQRDFYRALSCRNIIGCTFSTNGNPNFPFESDRFQEVFSHLGELANGIIPALALNPFFQLLEFDGGYVHSGRPGVLSLVGAQLLVHYHPRNKKRPSESDGIQALLAICRQYRLFVLLALSQNPIPEYWVDPIFGHSGVTVLAFVCDKALKHGFPPSFIFALPYFA